MWVKLGKIKVGRLWNNLKNEQLTSTSKIKDALTDKEWQELNERKIELINNTWRINNSYQWTTTIFIKWAIEINLGFFKSTFFRFYVVKIIFFNW